MAGDSPIVIWALQAGTQDTILENIFLRPWWAEGAGSDPERNYI